MADQQAYNNNNNIYLTAIEFSPGGSGKSDGFRKRE